MVLRTGNTISRFADIHSHILFSLDDGPADKAGTIDMIKLAAESGTRHIIATPHLIPDALNFAGDFIDGMCRQLQDEADNSGIDIKIYPGMEVFISPEILKLLSQGIIRTLNDSAYLLIEFPMSGIPVYTDEILFELQLKGFVPIIAHPERNMDIQNDPSIFISIAKRGILGQVNAGSITGLYGRTAKRTAMKLIKAGAVQFVASDAHSSGRRTPELRAAASAITARYGREVAEMLFYRNGMAVISNTFVTNSLV